MKKIRQREIAEKMGVTNAYVNMVLSGKKAVNEETMMLISTMIDGMRWNKEVKVRYRVDKDENNNK